MKILGTGLSGLVGSRIVELLHADYGFVDLSLDSGVDITDFNKLKSAFLQNMDAGVVLHLAAFTDVDKASQQESDKDNICYRVNVIGTENIAKLCRETKKYLIHISTDFVFDGRKTTPYTEEDKPNPIEWYGKTKLWAEESVKKSNCENVILRLAFPFKAKPSPGALEPSVKLDLVRKIKKRLEAGEEIKMFKDQVITPTFIDDAAKAIQYVVEYQPKGLYHLVGSTPISPFELAQKIALAFGLNKKLIKPASLADFIKASFRPRQKNLNLSNKRLCNDFGTKMSTIDEALKIIKGQLAIA